MFYIYQKLSVDAFPNLNVCVSLVAIVLLVCMFVFETYFDVVKAVQGLPQGVSDSRVPV